MAMKQLQNQEDTGMAWLKKLTPKQRSFAEMYAVHGNGSKAVLLAGYETANDGHDIANALRHNPLVLQAIEYYRALFASESDFSPEKVLKSLAEMASVDVSAFVTDEWDLRPKGQLSEAQRRALVGLEVIEKKDGRTVKPKFAKLEALKELAKIMGMYADVDENRKDGLAITINLGQQVNVNGEVAAEEVAVGHLRIGKAHSE